MRRRDFLTRGAATAGAVAVPGFPYHLFAASSKKYATDRIKLGPKQVELSRLALGTGTNGIGGSSNQTRKLGVGGVADLFKAGYDLGLTFWDSADQYGSHPHVREALKSVAREKITLLTKTHAATEKEAKADLDRFRRELNTDYLDILLLHCMMDADWPERRKGAMAAIAEAREKGIVRTHGISSHDLGALKTSARNPWVQVQLARINFIGEQMDAEVKAVVAVLKELKAAGKGVIGMKILGAGKLRNHVDEALQYALSLGCVDCFTIGAESRSEMADLVKRIPAASTRG